MNFTDPSADDYLGYTPYPLSADAVGGQTVAIVVEFRSPVGMPVSLPIEALPDTFATVDDFKQKMLAKAASLSIGLKNLLEVQSILGKPITT